ncbi:hypothetical protein AMD24_00231 [Candidatus Xiphinematobacter sp. Idaho Grape]|uniref:hypothetical protein n=1 Tax=Candidatus Xiphinematobacter sp. Idaho Grape TaxID=1704307 RepID=UPI000706007B|nr:hypothetical protein [Candidatus Xiphinematobacter sp. Idaho Grape]ALJ56419.1 hypothetical protein AMD24_00231 [Candidatus Xiphinematobacter sp. Idaho Grape]
MAISLLPISGKEAVGSMFFPEGYQRSIDHDEQKRVLDQILDGELTAERLVEIEQRWGLHAYQWSLVSALSGKLAAGVQTLFSNQV